MMGTPLVAIRQPETSPAPPEPPRRAIDDMRGYLPRVFRDTEEANRQAILDAIRDRRGGALLDIGVHTGEFTARIIRQLEPKWAAGVEVIPDYVRLARDRGIDARVADVEEGLPFDNASFDVVIANQVVEHVRRTDLFMTEISRVLAPGGIACVSTNNIASWHNIASLLLGFQPMPMHVSDETIIGNPLTPDQGAAHADSAQAHLRLFTRRALVELAQRHGLRPRRVWGVGYYPLAPRVARIACAVDPAHAVYASALFEPQSVR